LRLDRSTPLVDLHIEKGIFMTKLTLCLGLPAALVAFMSYF